MASVQGPKSPFELEESGGKTQGHWCSWAIKNMAEKRDFKNVKTFLISQSGPGLPRAPLEWSPLTARLLSPDGPARRKPLPRTSLLTRCLPCHLSSLCMGVLHVCDAPRTARASEFTRHLSLSLQPRPTAWAGQSHKCALNKRPQGTPSTHSYKLNSCKKIKSKSIHI